MGAANLIDQSVCSTVEAVPNSYCLRAARSSLQFSVQHEQQLAYALASRFVATQFAKVYHAECQQFSPTLLSVKRERDICGVLGIRLASQHKLYLEYYLPAGVEQVLSQHLDQTISRDSIIEVGNFAASKGGVCQLLLLATGYALRLLGYRWLVFTATTQVQHILQRMQWPVTPLAAATPESLPGGGAGWGSYYAGQPQVVVGDLWAAAPMLQHQAVQQVFSQHRLPLRKLEASLRGML